MGEVHPGPELSGYLCSELYPGTTQKSTVCGATLGTGAWEELGLRWGLQQAKVVGGLGSGHQRIGNHDRAGGSRTLGLIGSVNGVIP